MAMVVALAVASQASAQSLLQLAYNSAKDFGNVQLGGTGSGQGAIDITNGAMIVNTAGFTFIPDQTAGNGYGFEYGTPGVPETGDAAIHDAILEGLNAGNGGYENGTNGIYSSVAATNTSFMVGWLDNGVLGNAYSTFRGVTVPPNSSIIAYTYSGDTDLSGNVDSADLINLGNNYNQSTGGYIGHVDWYDGDNDYSGNVGSAELINLGNNYNLPPIYSAGPVVPAASAAIAAVPEPATVLLLVVAALCGCGIRFVRRSRS
jgi:hypothetical protein